MASKADGVQEQARIQEQVRKLVSEGQHKCALQVVLNHHGPSLFAYLVTRLPQRADAEDVYQDLALGLLRSLPVFRGECPIRAWAFVIARNLANSFHRSNGRLEDPWTSSVLEIAAQSLHSTPALERECLLAERRALVVKGSEALSEETWSEEDWEIVRLYYLGLSWEEVAHVLQGGEGEVTSKRTQNLKQRFHRKLEPRLRKLGREIDPQVGARSTT
ncbi:MAG: sigma-70 family RNA polymerase sigma factor [Deltaproteobacteria bacterium]|nr:sigma-70 family RNA polymerase sigma factor [Deltaproteobacteria bacterium]